MDNLYWPLSVLSRAIHFKNLTGASAHVGLSQPQLSRIISQIESELGVTLLDRSAKRKSGWTKTAHELAKIYDQSNRRLQVSLRQVVEEQVPSVVHMGTLEGLSHIGIQVAEVLLKAPRVNMVELNVYDQSELEEKHISGDLDLIITSRVPGMQKPKFLIELGFQSLKTKKVPGPYLVQSPFEHGQQKSKKGAEKRKTLISNSLFIRRNWLDQYGGEGILPSPLTRQGKKGDEPVLILANELFNTDLWQSIKSTSITS